jgi:glutaredoxin-like protein NrdH
MSVTVYSKPDCVQCTMTYKALNNAGIEFTVIDMMEDADALAKVKALGFMAAPVVVTESDSWAGFRPDKVKSLQAQLIAA